MLRPVVRLRAGAGPLLGFELATRCGHVASSRASSVANLRLSRRVLRGEIAVSRAALRVWGHRWGHAEKVTRGKCCAPTVSGLHLKDRLSAKDTFFKQQRCPRNPQFPL